MFLRLKFRINLYINSTKYISPTKWKWGEAEIGRMANIRKVLMLQIDEWPHQLFPYFPWTLPKYKATFSITKLRPKACKWAWGVVRSGVFPEGRELHCYQNFLEVSSSCVRIGKFSMYLLWLKVDWLCHFCCHQLRFRVALGFKYICIEIEIAQRLHHHQVCH